MHGTHACAQIPLCLASLASAMSNHGMHARLFFAFARCCFRRRQLLVCAIAINAIRRLPNSERAANALQAHMPPVPCKFQALRASAAVPYLTIVAAYTSAHREQHPAHGPGLVSHAAVQARREARAGSSKGQSQLGGHMHMRNCNSSRACEAYDAQSCWVDYQALRSPAGLY